jgi:hypothetical protein
MPSTILTQTVLKAVFAFFFEKSFEINQKQCECKVLGQNTGKPVLMNCKITRKHGLIRNSGKTNFVKTIQK